MKSILLACLCSIFAVSCSSPEKGQIEIVDHITKINGNAIVLNQNSFSSLFPEVADRKKEFQFAQVLSTLSKKFETDSASVLSVTADTILYKRSGFEKGEMFVFSKNQTACVVLNNDGMIIPIFNPLSELEIRNAFNTKKN